MKIIMLIPTGALLSTCMRLYFHCNKKIYAYTQDVLNNEYFAQFYLPCAILFIIKLYQEQQQNVRLTNDMRL